MKWYFVFFHSSASLHRDHLTNTSELGKISSLGKGTALFINPIKLSYIYFLLSSCCHDKMGQRKDVQSCPHPIQPLSWWG